MSDRYRKLYGVFCALFLAILILGVSPAQAVTLPDPALDPIAAGGQTIVLAGGCFWGVQGVFSHVKGVTKAVSGYAGGSADTAHYETVSTGTTGHAESVQVTYDPSRISLGQILKIYFSVAHDPTELNRQSPDSGTQYRSAIFATTSDQQKTAEAYIDQLQKAKVFSAPIVTTVQPLKGFYPAEDYHQDFYKLHPDNPYILFNDRPKVAALKKEFPQFYIEAQ